MCLVNSPKAPKPAPIQRPAPVLEQEAPEATDEVTKKSRRKRIGTKAYRAGSSLAIPKASSGSLNIAG